MDIGGGTAAHSGHDRIRLVRTDDDALWDRLVQSSPAATTYHTWDWLDLQQELLHLRLDRRLVVRDDVPVGVFPIDRSGPGGRLSRDLPFPFLGPLVPEDLLGGTVRALRRLQRSLALLEVQFDLPPIASTATAAAALRAAGVAVTEDATVVVDLEHGSPEALRQGYAKPRQRNLRRSQRDGVVVRKALPGEFTSMIGPVLDEAYGGRGRDSPYPAALGPLFEAWAEGHPDAGVLVAFREGDPVGVLVVLGGGPTAIPWIGGALRHARESFPNVLLHDRMFLDAIDAGSARVDLSGWVDEAIGRYKLGFGGERRTYLVCRSSLLPSGVLHAARGAVRGLRRRGAGDARATSAESTPA